MLDFSTVTIKEIVIHRVGNKHNEEDFFISSEPTVLTSELENLMLDYFVKPFTHTLDANQFTHEVALSYNELNGISKDFFQNPDSLYINSVKILKHLHEQSNHPHIKSGDLFVVQFDDILFEDKMVSALGIFKSENKTSFVQINQDTTSLELKEQKGIDIKKLDKGCFILNTEQEDGFRVFQVDSNNYDTEYWLNEFLSITPTQNEYFHTKEYVNLCKGFAKEVVQPTENKTEEIAFLHKSVQYLEQNEEVDLVTFKDEVLVDDTQKKEFDQYKSMYENEHNVAIPDSFSVSTPVVQKQKKQIKNEIKLDTNIQIKVAVNSSDSVNKFIEQGYDHEKEMHFYKVYFNNELN